MPRPFPYGATPEFEFNSASHLSTHHFCANSAGLARESIRLVPTKISVTRVVETLLSIAALMLLTVCISGYLHRSFSGLLALRQFEQSKSAEGKGSGDALADADEPRKVDSRLWSNTRIRGYLDSLNQHISPPLAVLVVEKPGITVPVFAGTDELTLNRGAGLIQGTSRPGQQGNVGIAGHRDGFFRALKDIAEGDELRLETVADVIRYRVDSVLVVTPDDVSVLAPRGWDSLTLVTCYPFYFIGDAPRRYIVRATKQPAVKGVSGARTNATFIQQL